MKLNRTDFLKDQSKNYGNTGNRFSVITYRVALSVFSRSPAAYEALKSFNILTLPSVSTLKIFMRSNVEDLGPVYDRMAEEQKKNTKCCKNSKENKGSLFQHLKEL